MPLQRVQIVTPVYLDFCGLCAQNNKTPLRLSTWPSEEHAAEAHDLVVVVTWSWASAACSSVGQVPTLTGVLKPMTWPSSIIGEMSHVSSQVFTSELDLPSYRESALVL